MKSLNRATPLRNYVAVRAMLRRLTLFTIAVALFAASPLCHAQIQATDTPLQDDDQAQRIMRCGQFLAQMFPSGTFQDDTACH